MTALIFNSCFFLMFSSNRYLIININAQMFFVWNKLDIAFSRGRKANFPAGSRLFVFVHPSSYSVDSYNDFCLQLQTSWSYSEFIEFFNVKKTPTYLQTVVLSNIDHNNSVKWYCTPSQGMSRRLCDVCKPCTYISITFFT